MLRVENKTECKGNDKIDLTCEMPWNCKRTDSDVSKETPAAY